MTKWILVLVALVAISIPSLAQADKDQDKDRDKSGYGSEQHRDKDKDKDKDRDKGKSGGTEQQVKAIDDQYRQAVLKGDTDFMQKHMADNYLSIGSNGQEMTKDQVIRNRKEGKTKYDAIDLKDTKVRTFGNTAIVEHEAHVKGITPSGPIDGDFRATLVWVKQGNDWKLVSFQSTPEQGAQAATNK